MAEPARPLGPQPALAPVRPDGRRLRLRRGVQDPRRRGSPARRPRADDDLAGLVAGRLRPLRGPVHPDELALRRHVPHRGRPRRWRQRRTALRPPQQLAGQREPGQGAPAALADQEEVRQQDLLGRPDHLRGPLRLRVDGPADVRLRLRARGHLRARGDLLGPGGHLARRRALQRRPGARRSARRRADGPDLREPGGPERPAERAGRRPRHPRDVRPHGDERRGDRRADHRRPHGRQGPRRRDRRPPRPGARRCAAGGSGAGLEEPLRHRKGRRHDHQRPRGRLDHRADEVGQRLPGQPVQVRLGPGQEPGRGVAVGADGPGGQGHGARRPRPGEAARPDHVHHRPRDEAGPDLRSDRQALPRRPRVLLRGLRQGLVQAAASRHGADHALPGPVGRRAAAVAGPRARGRPRAGRRPGRRLAQAHAPGLGAVGRPAGRHRLVVGVELPRAPTSGAAPTGRGSA